MVNRDKYIEQKMKNYKTFCCNAKTRNTGRATAWCVKCGEDAMLEMVLIADMFGKEFDAKLKN